MQDGIPSRPDDELLTGKVLLTLHIAAALTLRLIYQSDPQTLTIDWLFAQVREAAAHACKSVPLRADEAATVHDVIGLLRETLDHGFDD